MFRAVAIFVSAGDSYTVGFPLLLMMYAAVRH